MAEEGRVFGAEPDGLRRLITSGLEADDAEAGAELPGAASVVGLMEGPGTTIGPYKLLHVLGEGGMGIVYLAEQEGAIRRQVALKIIKPGMDSRRVIARFETERQVLALLDHPGIARVYDAGTTTSGRPYFVMEYVKGAAITEYCDHHTLSIEDRLRIFQRVCLAVHHAHQKGVIHRDIKPSNILVSTEGDEAIPKIIDFGVAKAISQPLTERTLFTEDGHLLGTPEYMSPEQADMLGDDVDTRCDVYSLGVVLYVLLTGMLPFDSEELRHGGVEHIRKTIRETNPKTPSTRLTKLGAEARKLAENRRSEVTVLAKRLHRELEWIPLKAIRKERSERYRSASELADDIENYLQGNPLIAGPVTAGYRLRKLVRRHRALVAAVMAVVVALTAGLIASTALYFRAERLRLAAQQAAEKEAATRVEAQSVTDFLKSDVLMSARDTKGREAMVVDILTAAIARLDEGRFRNQPLIEAPIRETLGRTYYDLGYYALAAQQQKPAYLIYLEQLGENHTTTNMALNWLAVFYYHAGKYQEAVPLYQQVIAKARQQKAGGLVENLPVLNANLGIAYTALGRYEEAEELLRPGTLYGGLAGVYLEQGKYEAAERVLPETWCALPEPQEKEYDARSSSVMVNRMNFVAFLRLAQGRDKEAEDLFQRGLDLGARALPGKDHPRMLHHVNGLALIRIKQQHYAEAKTLLDRALVGRRLKLGDDHPDTIRTIHDLGILYREQGQFDKAEQLLTEACHRRKAILGPEHPRTLESVHELGVLQIRQVRYQDAERLLLDAFHGREAKLGPDHPHTVESLKQLVTLYESWPKPEEAQKWRAMLPHKDPTEE